ncbi:MAG: DUF4124 domain-containing protein [Pseudomonadales bacterium]|nr:DUF4124 domain-containing protein [Pseudomonadales bacterium]
MKILGLLILLLPVLVQAEIYKCSDNDRVVYSDSPCGKEVEMIDVEELTKSKGVRFSSDDIKIIGNLLGKERKRIELDRSITKQENKIDKIIDEYSRKTKDLKTELAELNKTKNTASWVKHSYKKEQYYEEKTRLNDEVKEVRRSYKTEKEKAYNKLYSLRADRRRIP